MNISELILSISIFYQLNERVKDKDGDFVLCLQNDFALFPHQSIDIIRDDEEVTIRLLVDVEKNDKPKKKKRKISLDDNNIKQLKKRRLDIKKESGDLNNNKTEENGLPLFVIQNLEDLNKLNNVNIKKAKSLTSIHEPNSSKSSDEKSSSSSIEVEKSTPKKNVEKKTYK